MIQSNSEFRCFCFKDIGSGDYVCFLHTRNIYSYSNLDVYIYIYFQCTDQSSDAIRISKIYLNSLFKFFSTKFDYVKFYMIQC